MKYKDGDYWVSCPKFTILVGVKDDEILSPAPLIWKFRGQPMDNLINWCERVSGSCEIRRLSNEDYQKV